MDKDILDAMSAAGMSVILTESNREEVSKALIVKNSQIKSKQDMLEQFGGSWAEKSPQKIPL